MSKKPLAYKGLMGGITYESAILILKFLRNEADMDDDSWSVEYYNGMLQGMESVRNGEIFSQRLLKEIKAYGIEIIEHPTSVAGDDRSLIELGEDRYQDRPSCAQ
jgi:hypothetical protein